jgi:hypothetical protein
MIQAEVFDTIDRFRAQSVIEWHFIPTMPVAFSAIRTLLAVAIHLALSGLLDSRLRRGGG